MTLTEFTKVFRIVSENKNTDNKQIDTTDKEVLSLLILGYWPKRTLTISREYDGDAMGVECARRWNGA